MSISRMDLDGNPIKPMTICMIGAGGFIGSHLCEKLIHETPHRIIALDVYNDKIRHLLDCGDISGRIQFHRLNIKHDSRLEGLIKMSDLTINLAAICTPADYNTRPLDTIYSNFIDALPVVKYCSENGKRLIHFSTCEVYGKTIGSFLPKDSPLRQENVAEIVEVSTARAPESEIGEISADSTTHVDDPAKLDVHAASTPGPKADVPEDGGPKGDDSKAGGSQAVSDL